MIIHVPGRRRRAVKVTVSMTTCHCTSTRTIVVSSSGTIHVCDIVVRNITMDVDVGYVTVRCVGVRIPMRHEIAVCRICVRVAMGNVGMSHVGMRVGVSHVTMSHVGVSVSMSDIVMSHVGVSVIVSHVVMSDIGVTVIVSHVVMSDIGVDIIVSYVGMPGIVMVGVCIPMRGIRVWGVTIPVPVACVAVRRVHVRITVRIVPVLGVSMLDQATVNARVAVAVISVVLVVAGDSQSLADAKQ
jgi:hypothetical protein